MHDATINDLVYTRISAIAMIHVHEMLLGRAEPMYVCMYVCMYVVIRHAACACAYHDSG